VPAAFLADLPGEPFIPRIAASFALALAAATITGLLVTRRWSACCPVAAG